MKRTIINRMICSLILFSMVFIHLFGSFKVYAAESIPIDDSDMIDITVPLNFACTINPNIENGFIYASNLTIQNNSDEPIYLNIASFVDIYDSFENDILPYELPIGKTWNTLDVSNTKRYFALGLKANDTNEWASCFCEDFIYAKTINELGYNTNLGIVDSNSNVSFDLNAYYGKAFEHNMTFTYQITWVAELYETEASLFNNMYDVDTQEESIFEYEIIRNAPIEVATMDSYNLFNPMIVKAAPIDTDNEIDGICYISGLKDKNASIIHCSEYYRENDGSLYEIIGIKDGTIEQSTIQGEFIERIELSPKMKDIGNFAIGNCPNLNEVIITSNISSFGENNFLCCDNLSLIEVPNKEVRDFITSSTLLSKELFYSIEPIATSTLFINKYLDNELIETISLDKEVGEVIEDISDYIDISNSNEEYDSIETTNLPHTIENDAALNVIDVYFTSIIEEEVLDEEAPVEDLEELPSDEIPSESPEEVPSDVPELPGDDSCDEPIEEFPSDEVPEEVPNEDIEEVPEVELPEEIPGDIPSVEEAPIEPPIEKVPDEEPSNDVLETPDNEFPEELPGDESNEELPNDEITNETPEEVPNEDLEEVPEIELPEETPGEVPSVEEAPVEPPVEEVPDEEPSDVPIISETPVEPPIEDSIDNKETIIDFTIQVYLDGILYEDKVLELPLNMVITKLEDLDEYIELPKEYIFDKTEKELPFTILEDEEPILKIYYLSEEISNEIEELPSDEIPSETPEEVPNEDIEEVPEVELPEETPGDIPSVDEAPIEPPIEEVPDEGPSNDVLETPNNEFSEELPGDESSEELPNDEILNETPEEVLNENLEEIPEVELPGETPGVPSVYETSIEENNEI